MSCRDNVTFTHTHTHTRSLCVIHHPLVKFITDSWADNSSLSPLPPSTWRSLFSSSLCLTESPQGWICCCLCPILPVRQSHKELPHTHTVWIHIIFMGHSGDISWEQSCTFQLSLLPCSEILKIYTRKERRECRKSLDISIERCFFFITFSCECTIYTFKGRLWNVFSLSQDKSEVLQQD